jgi:hypothetical protein
MILSKNPYSSWQIKSADYPKKADISAQIEFMLGYATLAPSTFNSQPWKCQINNGELKVFLDLSRMPEKSDKSGRFGYVSLGCFLQNLTIASEYFGWKVETTYPMKKGRGNILVAVVTFTSSKKTVSQQTKQLFKAIPERVTNRSLSKDKKISQKIFKNLTSQAGNNQRLITFSETEKPKIKEISKIGDMEIWSDFDFRKEHTAWIRHNLTKEYDGMPAFGVGIGLIPSLVAKPMVLSPVFAKLQTKKNQQTLESSHHFGVLCGVDDPISWIKIGALFETLSLIAAKEGISLSPMGQFIECDKARDMLTDLVAKKTKLKPQLFFRMGYPSLPTRQSPRIPVSQILI